VDPEVLADARPDYHATERFEIDWGGGGCPYYRRPLGELVGAVTDAEFVVSDVVEPEPDGEFREAYPEWPNGSATGRRSRCVSERNCPD
jgi:hypothetical protein